MVSTGLGLEVSPCLKTLGCLHSWMWAWVTRLMGIRPLYALLSNVICSGVQSKPWADLGSQTHMTDGLSGPQVPHHSHAAPGQGSPALELRSPVAPCPTHPRPGHRGLTRTLKV